jgi:hypothetical protein
MRLTSACAKNVVAHPTSASTSDALDGLDLPFAVRIDEQQEGGALRSVVRGQQATVVSLNGIPAATAAI